MASPFPGMDPYLEDPIEWPELHIRLIMALSRQLSAQVTPHFYVRVEQRVSIVDPDDEQERRVIMPDIFLAQSSTPATASNTSERVIATPTLISTLDEDLEVREYYLAIYDARSRTVVTTIELLSPVNKAGGAKQAAFQAKRQAVMASPAHWIEIDLLRAGERPAEVAGKSDYYALLKRAGQRGPLEVWFCDLRDPLPTIAVPLRSPFADVPLDLQVALDSAYAEARYDAQLNYAAKPPPPPLRRADAAWVGERIAAWQAQS